MAKRIAIEIGGTKFQAALGTSDGAILTVRRCLADAAGGCAANTRQIRELVEPLLAEPVEQICIGFGGPVDRETGRAVMSHHVGGWDDFPLRDWAEQTFGRPCLIENDSNCGGLAEAVLGAGRGAHCVFYTNIGSGIGGAIVIDGKLHNGHNGAAEIGHTLLWDRDSQQYVLAENLCSGWSLERRARRLAAAGQLPNLLHLAGSAAEQIDGRLIGEALAAGEGAAERLVDELAANFAVALANMVAMINPGRIVIGGGVSLMGKPLLDRLERHLRSICFAPYRDNWRLVAAELGENVVLAGALLLK